MKSFVEVNRIVTSVIWCTISAFLLIDLVRKKSHDVAERGREIEEYVIDK